MGWLQKAAERLDGWANLQIGLGGVQDKRIYGRIKPGAILSTAQCATLFHHEWMARTVCELLPQKGMRDGFTIQIADEDDSDEQSTLVQMRMDELGLWAALMEAAIWGRCYGGGAVFLGIDDGQGPELALNEDNVRAINQVIVLDRRNLDVVDYDKDPNSRTFGQPLTYRIRRAQDTSGVVVHASRMIVFPGALTGDDEKRNNSGWDYSVLQVVYEELRDWGVTWAGASLLLQEASQAVYSVKNLTTMLARQDGEAALRTRFRLIDQARSIARALIIDADGEKFERHAVSFAGVPDMLVQFSNRMAAATRIPVTILMGQAPAGLNATGASDLLTFQSTVEEWQTQILLPRLERVVSLLFREGGTEEPKSWSIDIAFGIASTPTEEAARKKTVAETDAIYLSEGVVTSDEIARSRFSRSGYSAETIVDLSLREPTTPAQGDLGTVGAQIDVILTILTQVQDGVLPKESAKILLTAKSGLTDEQANALVDPIPEPVEEPEEPLSDPGNNPPPPAGNVPP